MDHYRRSTESQGLASKTPRRIAGFVCCEAAKGPAVLFGRPGLGVKRCDACGEQLAGHPCRTGMSAAGQVTTWDARPAHRRASRTHGHDGRIGNHAWYGSQAGHERCIGHERRVEPSSDYDHPCAHAQRAASRPYFSGTASPAGASPSAAASSPSASPPGIGPMPPLSDCLGSALFLPSVVASSRSPVARNSPSV